jgi:hypothetical protein
MPDFTTGGRRLAHAMMYGHLGEVMSCLVQMAQADLTRLSVVVEDTWDDLISRARSPSCRRRVRDLRKQTDTVGAVLWRRITRAHATTFL